MTVTYTDVVYGMVEANESGESIDKVILTEGSMQTFLTDGKFKKSAEEDMESSIGTVWEVEIESGDGDYILTDSGKKIHL